MRTVVALALLLLIPTTTTIAAANARESASAVRRLRTWLKVERSERPAIGEQDFAAVPLTERDAATARTLLVGDRVQSIRAERAAEMEQRIISRGERKMPFDVRTFGRAPRTGRSLFISMHGGGGTAKRVNDQQWENQKRLYQPKEGVYVAPRAPTDTWNLWHQSHIDPMFDRLVENLVVFADVDPNRVYLMGYSAGGDGVYQLAPRMADRFAAASMMAGHPNDASPLGLRNLPFAIHVGALDAAYKRNEVARTWGERLGELRTADAGGYEYVAEIHAGRGHWMNLEDAVAVPWMAKHTRNPRPEKIVWVQDDVVHRRFYWLAVDEADARKGVRIDAERDGQTIRVTSQNAGAVTVRLDDALVDLDEPVTVIANGRTAFEGRVNRTIAGVSRTLSERGDRELVFPAEVRVTLSAD